MLFIIIVFYLRYIIIFVTIFNLLLLYFIDSLFLFSSSSIQSKAQHAQYSVQNPWAGEVCGISSDRGTFWEIACCTMAMNLELSLVLVCLRQMKHNEYFLLL